MITNRIWCAAPGSVDAVGKSLQGCRRLRPHHENHQLGVRVPTTERTARVGPPSPLLLRSPQPMPLAGLFPQTVLITPSFTDLISFLSTPSTVLHLLRSLLDLLPRLLFSSPFQLSSSNQTGKDIVLRASRRGPARRRPVWEDAIGAPTSQTWRNILGCPIRSLCAALHLDCDPTALKTGRSKTARSMFP
jgi:hypothetical protein